MSLDARIQRNLENDADTLQNMIEDFHDKWGIENTIGLLKPVIGEYNKKRIFPAKKIVIGK